MFIVVGIISNFYQQFKRIQKLTSEKHKQHSHHSRLYCRDSIEIYYEHRKFSFFCIYYLIKRKTNASLFVFQKLLSISINQYFSLLLKPTTKCHYMAVNLLSPLVTHRKVMFLYNIQYFCNKLRAFSVTNTKCGKNLATFFTKIGITKFFFKSIKLYKRNSSSFSSI